MGSGPHAPAPLCEAGRAALAQGQWNAARAAFGRAVDEHESAEAVEGLSWAAWWLDDAGTTFSARERAFHLHRTGGNPAGAARMAIWLAVDHLDFHGAVAVTEGWLRRARRLLEPLDPGPEHGWLAFVEGFLAHAAGDTSTALQAADRAGELGQRWNVPDLQVLGLALRGAALVAAGQVREGMGCLDEAAATALQAEVQIPISSAWTCCFLVTACSSVRDYPRAVQWCDQIGAFAERYGSRYMLAFCRAEYGVVELWRGDWARAEELLAQAVEDFTCSRPAWAVAPTVWLAELRRRQGRVADAQALLAAAGSDADLVRARLVLDEGDAASAAAAAERLLRRLPDGDRPEALPVLELLVVARLVAGDVPGAEAAVGELHRVARLVETPAVRAGTDLLEGVLTAGLGDDRRARRLLEDAVDGLAQAGGAYEAARGRVELAATLARLGDVASARREATAAREVLDRLGAAPEAARAGRLLRGLEPHGGPDPVVTPREREVLGLLAEGLTNREIAARLVLSEHTVHRHLSNILRKLGVPTRAAAAAYAVRSGLAPRRTG